MAGINSYTKLLFHFNGDDESQNIIDDSPIGRTVTVIGDTHLEADQKKFGDTSGFFDGNDDRLDMVASEDFHFGTGNFTIDFWVRLVSGADSRSNRIIQFDTASGQFILQLSYAPSSYTNIFFYANYPEIYEKTPNGVLDFMTTDVWYHIALVRNGTNFQIYVNGTSYLSITRSIDIATPTSNVSVGGIPGGIYDGVLGYLDEFRIQKGEAAWTSNFTPSTEEYSEAYPLIDEEENLTFEESIDINELSKIFIETETLTIDEDVTITEFLKYFSTNETLTISENVIIGSIGLIETIFNTDLRTKIIKASQYLTYMLTSILSFNKFNTQLHLKTLVSSIFNTDLRVKFENYDSITVGSLNDFIVKLDGVELTDVDYSTLRIKYALNTTPSSANFVLARRHDNFDYKLDGTYSQISNENKIEIYDGTFKIFTGYVTEIQGLSQTDTVQITAEDVRYKLSRISMNIWYGGRWVEKYYLWTEFYHYGWTEAKNMPTDIDLNKFDKEQIRFIMDKRTIGEAFGMVLVACASYISGYDPIPFSMSYVPEYVETDSTILDLLNTLITQTANANWYIDTNERLCWQLIEFGTIKSIPLSSTNKHRHIYDAIISDVILNKQNSAYAKSLECILGTNITRTWYRRIFAGWESTIQPDLFNFCQGLKEYVAFCFQNLVNDEAHADRRSIYVGMNLAIRVSMGIQPEFDIQYTHQDSIYNLPDFTIGSGLPLRTLNLNSYGKKETNQRWEEQVRTVNNNEETWLTSVIEESYNTIDYAHDMAGFELSQNNKLQTSAKVTILLDAYKYYNLGFGCRVNLTNTTTLDIYNNNNGFPLNIDNIEIDCSTRMVNLFLTNYNKSWYVKTENIIKNYIPPEYIYLHKKYQQNDFGFVGG